jgi:hypothetical protein
LTHFITDDPKEGEAGAADVPTSLAGLIATNIYQVGLHTSGQGELHSGCVNNSNHISGSRGLNNNKNGLSNPSLV